MTTSFSFVRLAQLCWILYSCSRINTLGSINDSPVKCRRGTITATNSKPSTRHDASLYHTSRRLDNIFVRPITNIGAKDVSPNYYTTSTDPALLPRNNYEITIGNPMKGLNPYPDWLNLDKLSKQLPTTLGDFKWGMSSVMLNDPDVVGVDAAFNWTFVESKLQRIAPYKLHAIVRFYIYWPGKPILLPSYLTKPPYNLTYAMNGTQLYYDNKDLKKAIKQCIDAFAARYDGDQRIFAIQAGFLGHWGEWHTYGCSYNGGTCLPSSVLDEAVQWMNNAFNKTHIEVRYPNIVSAYNAGFGFHDDSFTWSTMNGASYYFWNLALSAGTTQFWKWAPMGGEVRPENGQLIFNDSYVSGSAFKQDFLACVETTHATHMLWQYGWEAYNFAGVNGTERQRAQSGSVRMGYSFEIAQISVSRTSQVVNIDVTIQQTGVAPFYYPLFLAVKCNSFNANTSVPYTTLHTKYSTAVVTVQNIPHNRQCLNAVEFQLTSPNLYASPLPIKWAQGTNNGAVILSIPIDPSTLTQSPTGPTSKPTTKPTSNPTTKPTSKPTKKPTTKPTSIPTTNPTTKPTSIPTLKPIASPATQKPTSMPTDKPICLVSCAPTTEPTNIPTAQPKTGGPTLTPITKPSSKPTSTPTLKPTSKPSRNPTWKPSSRPTTKPTLKPTLKPTSKATNKPTSKPSNKPTRKPTFKPTATPTRKPTSKPSMKPTMKPSSKPTTKPTRKPTIKPTVKPTRKPTSKPTATPIRKPTTKPSSKPTSKPTGKPMPKPTSKPTGKPISAASFVTNLYFVNVTSNVVMYNIGPVTTGSVYNISKLGKSLSIVAETNISIVAINFTWPPNQYKWETSRPFALAGDVSSKYVSSSYVSLVGNKSIGVAGYIANNILAFRSQVNFTIR